MTLDVVLITILCAAVLLLLLGYDRLSRKLAQSQENEEEIRKRARENAIKIVEDAKDEAVKIVEAAGIEAGKRQQLMDSLFNQVNDEQVKDYKKSLQNISDVIKNEASREAEEFRRAITSETVGAEKAVTKRIEQEYYTAKEEIDKYRNETKQKIDEQAKLVLKDMTRKLIGRVIDLEGHNELIKQALDEARKDHVI